VMYWRAREGGGGGAGGGAAAAAGPERERESERESEKECARVCCERARDLLGASRSTLTSQQEQRESERAREWVGVSRSSVATAATPATATPATASLPVSASKSERDSAAVCASSLPSLPSLTLPAPRSVTTPGGGGGGEPTLPVSGSTIGAGGEVEGGGSGVSEEWMVRGVGSVGSGLDAGGLLAPAFLKSSCRICP